MNNTTQLQLSDCIYIDSEHKHLTTNELLIILDFTLDGWHHSFCQHLMSTEEEKKMQP